MRVIILFLTPTDDEKCDACRAAPENCGHKKGHDKRIRPSSENQTEEVQD